MEAAIKKRKLWRRDGETPLNSQKEYRTLYHIKQRCLSVKCKSYPRYGGRGITICEKWLGTNGYTNFLNDVGRAPSSAHSLDRVNNNGNYEPGNCRWATMVEQNNNRNDNVLITIGDNTNTLSQWARIMGVSPYLISNRISHYKWNPVDAVLKPKQDSGLNLIPGRRKGTKNKKPYYRKGMKSKQENIV